MERPGFFGGMDNMTLDELNKASKRWMVNDDGIFKSKTGRKKGNNPSAGPVKDYTAGTSQKPSDNIVTQEQKNVKSVLALLWLNQEIKLSL